MGILEMTPERSVLALPGIQSFQGSDGVELLVDADCQAYVATRYAASGDISTPTKEDDEVNGGRALRCVSTGVSGEGWATQTIISDNTTYRYRGKFRCSGGTVEPYLFAGLTELPTGIAAGTTEWTEFDVIGISGAGVAVAYFGCEGMNAGDWFEFRDLSVQEVKQVTPAIGQIASRRLGAELFADADMEAAGVASWTAVGSVLTKVTTDPVTGTQNLRVTSNAAVGGLEAYAQQTILTVGRRYRLKAYVRGDGTRTPYIYDFLQLLYTGSASTTWQYAEVEFTATSTAIDFLTSGFNPVGTEYIEVDIVSCKEIEVSGARPLMGSDGETSAEFPSIIRPRGFSFDGGDEITVPDSDLLSFTDGSSDLPFSIAVMLNFQAIATARAIVSKASGSAAGEYLFWISGTRYVELRLIDDSGNFYIGRRTDANMAILGIPQVYIATYDGTGLVGGIKVFIESAQADTTNSATGGYVGMEYTTNNVSVGSGGGVSDFIGDMLVPPMIFDYELSPAEVASLTDMMKSQYSITP